MGLGNFFWDSAIIIVFHEFNSKMSSQCINPCKSQSCWNRLGKFFFEPVLSSLSSTNAIPRCQVNTATIASHNPAEMGLGNFFLGQCNHQCLPQMQFQYIKSMQQPLQVTILLKWALGNFIKDSAIIIIFHKCNSNISSQCSNYCKTQSCWNGLVESAIIIVFHKCNSNMSSQCSNHCNHNPAEMGLGIILFGTVHRSIFFNECKSKMPSNCSNCICVCLRKKKAHHIPAGTWVAQKNAHLHNSSKVGISRQLDFD